MNIELLKESLNLLNDFPEHIYYINSGTEYLSIYERSLKDIEQIAQERGSAYIKGKLKEYPTLTSKEVDEYIRLKSDHKSLLSKNQNFTIVSVSVDKPRDREKWLDAIKADGLVWTQLLDDKKTSDSYGVESLPSAFLIDPEGNLLRQGKTLHRQDLM